MAIDTPIVLLIVAYVVVGVIAWHILKKIIGVVITLSIFTLLIMSAFGFFVYRDIVDFKANLKNGNTIVMIDEGIALSGFTVASEKGEVLTKEQLLAASSAYEKGTLNELKGVSYKLFILTPQFIEPMNTPKFILEEQSLTKEQVLALLQSSDAIKTAEGYGINADQTSEEIKAQLLAQSFEEGIQNPLFMIARVKDGSLKVYPETALFKGMKYIPLSFIESAVSKIASQTKETATDITAKVVATVKS